MRSDDRTRLNLLADIHQAVADFQSSLSDFERALADHGHTPHPDGDLALRLAKDRARRSSGELRTAIERYSRFVAGSAPD